MEAEKIQDSQMTNEEEANAQPEEELKQEEGNTAKTRDELMKESVQEKKL